jgi:hypothetical protein
MSADYRRALFYYGPHTFMLQFPIIMIGVPNMEGMNGDNYNGKVPLLGLENKTAEATAERAQKGAPKAILCPRLCVPKRSKPISQRPTLSTKANLCGFSQ